MLLATRSPRYQLSVLTSSASVILWSWVRSVAPNTRAVATRMRSAGSRWKESGNEASSAATAGEMPCRRTSGGATAFSSHSRRGIVRRIRPRQCSIATSQSEISDTCNGESASAAAITSCWSRDSRPRSPCHHSRMCVSSNAFIASDCPSALQGTPVPQHRR